MSVLHITRLDHASHYLTPGHRHAEGQLYWLTGGMIALTCGEEQWALTPGCVGWLPAGYAHQSVACGAIQGWSLLLPTTLCAAMPPTPTLVTADSFLQALLVRLACPPPGLDEAAQQRLIAVLQDAFLLANPAALQLLLPVDKRARKVAQRLLSLPGERCHQHELAASAGLSLRTLSRLFTRQTGLTFARWRQQARVLRSLEALATGVPVTQVAAQYGYENTSAYIAAFRQRFGVTPGAYFPGVGLRP